MASRRSAPNLSTLPNNAPFANPRTSRLTVNFPRPAIFLKTALAAMLPLAAQSVRAAPDYTKDVVPILREYCAGCHNEDDFDGELSVETFAALMEGGESGPTVKPGHGNESFLIAVLTGLDKPKMPPKKEPQLSAKQIETLRAWIDGGAAGPAVDLPINMAKLEVPEIAPSRKGDPAITAAAYSPDGKQLAMARFESVDLVDPASGKVRLSLDQHEGKVNAVHFSKDGSQIITASGVTGLRGQAVIWDASNGKKIREFLGHSDILYDAELSPDGKVLATAGYDRRIILWDVATGEGRQTIAVHNGAIFDLAFSPDGAVLASASADETVKLWRISDGERLDTLNQPEAEQYTVCFTPDGKHILAGGADNRIRLWRFVSLEQPKLNPLLEARFAHEDAIIALEIAPDGKSVVSSSDDHLLKRWSLPKVTLMETLGGEQPDLVDALAIHPKTGAVLAARLDGSLETYAGAPEATQPGNSPDSPKTSPYSTTVAENVPAKPAPSVDAGKWFKAQAQEPDNQPSEALPVTLPAEVAGFLEKTEDVDLVRFHARAGEEWVLEVNAARSKSPVDSKLEILYANGEPVEQVVLQATRDSWFTFRGIDSNTVNALRVQNWEEMELNEYLYCNGEVVKLWLYPRGPDSGFNVYPGYGKRFTYFHTTALSHPQGEPCYIVRAFPPGTKPAPNGLPVFTLYYENDDDPNRLWGNDSQVFFTAPTEGDYLARVSDVRGFGGKDFAYTLKIRPKAPDFTVKVEGKNPKVNAGSGKEFEFKVDRLDGFNGPISIELSGLPDGFTSSSPIIVEAGQNMALGSLYAAKDAPTPSPEAIKASRLTATAKIGGQTVTKDLGSLGTVSLEPEPKLTVEILPDKETHVVSGSGQNGKPLEIVIAPGETITAQVKVTRNDFTGRVQFGKEDAGRNLPHGVFVDNIGLNGLLIPEDATERTFFITAASWVPDTTRTFHLRTAEDGKQVSQPVVIHVRKQETVAKSQ